MTYGRQPRIQKEVNWVFDEDGNLLGYQKNEREIITLVQQSGQMTAWIASLPTDPPVSGGWWNNGGIPTLA